MRLPPAIATVIAALAQSASRVARRLRPALYLVSDHLAGAAFPVSRSSRGRGRPRRLSDRVRLTVGCYANWPDFDDALHFLTPGSSGEWGDVAFVRPDGASTDWVGIFNQPRGRAIEFMASPNRVFFAIGEPPTRTHRPLHLCGGRGNIVFTSDEALAAANGGGVTRVLSPPMLRSWSVRRTYDQLRGDLGVEKHRVLSWITSDVAALEGHRYRLAFLARIRNELPLDLFGRGFRRIRDKWDGLAAYRYSIAFENFRAPHYFSEKIMDCFVCETMPIYYGSPRIMEYFPPESLVVIDPEDPDVVERVRSLIASDRWRVNRDAVLEAKRRVLEEYNVFASIARHISDDASPALPPEAYCVRPVRLAQADGK